MSAIKNRVAPSVFLGTSIQASEDGVWSACARVMPGAPLTVDLVAHRRTERVELLADDFEILSRYVGSQGRFLTGHTVASTSRSFGCLTRLNGASRLTP